MIIFLGCTNIPNYKPDNKSKVQSLIPQEKMGSGFFLPLSFLIVTLSIPSSISLEPAFYDS